MSPYRAIALNQWEPDQRSLTPLIWAKKPDPFDLGWAAPFDLGSANYFSPQFFDRDSLGVEHLSDTCNAKVGLVPSFATGLVR